MKLTSKKISFIAQELSNNETATDAEMILNLAQQVGAPICKVAKLVKAERTFFLNHICDYTNLIKKYLK
jgi:hypothetical protein